MNSIINIGVSFMKAILKISAALFLYFTFTMNATAVEKLDPHTTSVEAIAAYAKANGATVREQLLIVQRWISENIVYESHDLTLENQPYSDCDCNKNGDLYQFHSILISA